jgi:hypothetical protein
MRILIYCNALQGTDCSNCATGYWGPSCKRSCPACVNGLCNTTTGKCDCIGNTQGYLCNTCIDGNALHLITLMSLGYTTVETTCDTRVSQILYIAPTFGSADTMVTVKGVNLDAMDIECHFGGNPINGTVVSDSEIECVAPDSGGATSVQLTVLLNGELVPSPFISFTYTGNVTINSNVTHRQFMLQL